MAQSHIDVEAVLGDLKDFQQRTARWTFQRMFDERDPAYRFLVADEVGLGKTHIAKGVIAQVINELARIGDERHDIVYVCSNAAIARQNLRKLVPKGVEPLEDVGRLAMLPLVSLNEADGAQTGVNLIAITPGTSLKFGRSTGQYQERFLAYTFLRALWGAEVMTAPARWIFWEGLRSGDRHERDERLRSWEREHRSRITSSLQAFGNELEELDKSRRRHGKPTLRVLFDGLVDGLKWKSKIPDRLQDDHKELIGEMRRILAIVGIAALEPDLVVLDEFQRFKDLLRPDPDNFAAELAHRLFDYKDCKTGRATRTLLLSATPYRMYTTGDEIDSDHYADFLDTCAFLFGDAERVDRLKQRFVDLRSALTSATSLPNAVAICDAVASDLRKVMARTERLAATPSRDGMLAEHETLVTVAPDDLRAYMRFGDIAETVEHHEPTEFWKSAPYLVNFMEEHYNLKDAVKKAAADGRLSDDGRLDPGPGLLSWEDVESYQRIDPQNGRLRWLLEDLERHRAFEMLWVPPSLRYYDAESVYESEEAAGFTKRLIFSGWAVVPKVVSSLVSLEAERHASSGHHHYTAEYKRRGGSRLDFRSRERAVRAAQGGRAGMAPSNRRAATMTTFLLVWPSPSLAELGDPRVLAGGGGRSVSAVHAEVQAQVADAIAPMMRTAPTTGVVDRSWYWAVPLLLDRERHPAAVEVLLAGAGAQHWGGEDTGQGFEDHLVEARVMVNNGVSTLGRPPDDLAEVLAEVALGGPAQCALRAVSSVAGLAISHEATVSNAAWIAEAFRRFFNSPETTGVVVRGKSDDAGGEAAVERYWREVVRHSIDGNLQAVLDEHFHVLRDWLGHLNLNEDDQRVAAADDIGYKAAEALDLRTSLFRVDIPRRTADGRAFTLEEHRLRTRYAVAFGNQKLDQESGEARVESVSRAFNSPFWPFVLTSTSVGQEGLDFHLWCHAVVHWNLPSNPVDLEQREGRVHRYKGHAVRRNIAATLGADALRRRGSARSDLWDELFEAAAATDSDADGAIVPYWVFDEGPAKIQRHVPVLPFSRDAVAVSQLRKALAAYRLAFGQPRQEELVEFLSADRTDEELLKLTARLKIDLAPPKGGTVR